MKPILCLFALLTAANLVFAQSKPQKPVPKVATTTFPKVFKPYRTFLCDRADLHESLKVQLLGEGKIAYEVTMENGNCEKFTMRGVATAKKGDLESDIDEQNNDFEVTEYYIAATKGKCGLQLRIGAEKGYRNRARFTVFDCGQVAHCKDKTKSELLRAEQ
jgi:hypothetical protein